MTHVYLFARGRLRSSVSFMTRLSGLNFQAHLCYGVSIFCFLRSRYEAVFCLERSQGLGSEFLHFPCEEFMDRYACPPIRLHDVMHNEEMEHLSLIP
jgi:hypothetical protein